VAPPLTPEEVETFLPRTTRGVGGRWAGWPGWAGWSPANQAIPWTTIIWLSIWSLNAHTGDGRHLTTQKYSIYLLGGTEPRKNSSECQYRELVTVPATVNSNSTERKTELSKNLTFGLRNIRDCKDDLDCRRCYRQRDPMQCSYIVPL